MWDAVSTTFHDRTVDGQFIRSGWPVVQSAIASVDPAGAHALDFGCGSGYFSDQLSQMGYTVTGIDPSPDMIAEARQRYPDIEYLVGDKNTIPATPTFDLICSLRVLSFVRHVEPIIAAFHDALINDGICVIAVHSPQVLSAMNNALQIDGRSVPTYSRSTDNHDALFLSAGFERVCESHSTDSEQRYLILAYRKTRPRQVVA